MLCVDTTQSVGTTSADGHSFVKQLSTVWSLLQQTANKSVRGGGSNHLSSLRKEVMAQSISWLFNNHTWNTRRGEQVNLG